MQNRRNLQIIYLVNAFCFVFLIITVLFNSGYALATVWEDVGGNLLIIGYILLVIRTYMKRCRLGVRKDLPHLFFIIAIIGFFVSTAATAGSSVSLGSFRFLFTISFAFMLTRNIPFSLFSKYYLTSMFVVALVSLAGWLLAKYGSSIKNLQIVENINGTKYYVAYVFFSLLQSPGRNTGVFWEPGIFGSFLVFAIILEAKLKKEKPNKFRLLLFFVALVSTGSTAAIIIVPILLLLIIDSRTPLFYVLLSIVFGLCFWIIWGVGLEGLIALLARKNPELFEKMTFESISMGTRIRNPIIDMNIFKSHPLFGLGFQGYQNSFRHSVFSGEVNGQTSTITGMLAALGLAGFFYPISIFVGVVRQTSLTSVGKVLLLLIIVIIVSKEPHTNFVLTYCFIFYLLDKNTNSLFQKRSNALLRSQKPIIV